MNAGRSILGVGASLALLVLAIPGRQEPALRSASAAAPVPVTVRVFDGDRFVPDLTLKDFVIEEAGLAVSPQALFLLQKDQIERQEGRTDLRPDVSRKIFLIFQLTEYHAKIPDALEFFFGTELLLTDTLDIVTPLNTYSLSRGALATKSRETLARELTALLRKDIIKGGMAYNSAMRDLKRVVRQISGGGRAGIGDTEGEVDDGTSLELQLMQYSEHLQEMESFRVVEEPDLVALARRMKGRPGQRLVFFIYQREYRPEISSQTMDLLMMNNQERPDILAALQSLFPLYNRPMNVDRDVVMQAFAGSGMDFHFLFMNRQPERISGVTMREQSEDVFKALTGAAEATGGTTETSQDPSLSLPKALRATERSYLLFFTPSTSAPPGTFIPLEVRIKDKGYRVAHRSGYQTGS